MLNLFAISGILITFTSSLMVLLMFTRGRQRLHYLWGIFCVSVVFWGVGAFLVGITKDPSWADLWWRLTHIGVIFIPVLFFHFTYEFLQLKSRWLVILAYIFGFLFLITNFVGDLFIANMRWVFDQFYYDSPPGPVYIPFTAFFFGLVLYSHWRLWRAYQTAHGVRRTQIKYFLVGMGVSFAGGSLSFLPVYYIDFYPVFNIAASFYPAIIGYAIMKHRLMDIRMVVRQAVIYLSLMPFAYIIFYIVAGIYHMLWGGVFARQGFIAGIFIAFIFAIAFQRYQKAVYSFANRFFYVGIYNTQRTMEELSQKLTTIIDLDELAHSITETLTKTLGVQWAKTILLSEEHDYEKNDAWNQQELLEDQIIRKQLIKAGVPLIFDELSLELKETHDIEEKKRLRTILAVMEKHEVSIYVPLIARDELLGAIALGWKINNEAYSHEDVRLLRMIAAPAAVAIENAQLYEKSRKFGERLSKEVDMATRDLQKANQHLESLLTIKNEFLQIASHQLRTPVSVMRGVLDMLREGENLKPEQEKEFIERAYLKSEKLRQVIDDILSATEMDVPNFDISGTARSVDLKALAQKAVDSHMEDAADKGLSLTFAPADRDLFIKASETYLPQAMTNLIDNAIKYTKEGSVTVKVYPEGDKVVFAVQDTGMGVPEEDVEGLWNKFTRAKNAKNMYTDGSGLGLFIVKKIVEGHPGGEVFVESKEGQGSTFGFKLPMIKEAEKA